MSASSLCFNNSTLLDNYRAAGNQLGLHPHQNYDNVLSPIGMAPDAPVSRSRSVNHLAPSYQSPEDFKRRSMQHFGSNISLSGGSFPQPWQPTSGDRPMYDGPDLPSTDLPEDHLAAEPQPLPLDISKLHKVDGYDNVAFHTSSASTVAPIPPPLDVLLEDDKPEEKFSDCAGITEAEARDALLDFVADKCCYGKAAAQELQILDVKPTFALHYILETYKENRYTSWEHEPYRGQFVESASNGTAPLPWELHCNPTQMFHNEIHHLEVPFSSSILPCHGCASLGWIRCHICLGRGFLRCITCSGSGRTWHTDARGHKHTECCWHCHGTGRKTCFTCGGDGRLQCKTCQGYRQLKCYIKLTVRFENHMGEKIIEHTDLPKHLVSDVEGEIIFQQAQPKVWGITKHPDKDLCIQSQRLVTDEQVKFQKHSRIVMQKHEIQAVPVMECSYTWKDEEDGKYWVYGKDNTVFAPDYPQKYCWGCNIL